MKTILNILGTILFYVFYVVILGPYPLGIYHSVKKHSAGDAVASILIPPWGYYRGIEVFWHKDETAKDHVNWDKEMRTDLKVFSFLCNEKMNGKTSVESIEALSNLTYRYTQYPEDKKKELLSHVRRYIEYVEMCQRDLMKHINDVLDEKINVTDFQLSPNILKMEDDLKSYGLDQEVALTHTALEYMNKSTIKELYEKSFSKEEREEGKQRIAEFCKIQTDILCSFYKDIYKEYK